MLDKTSEQSYTTLCRAESQIIRAVSSRFRGPSPLGKIQDLQFLPPRPDSVSGLRKIGFGRVCVDLS